jgi:Type IV secretory system Conjugative DNA transfer
VLQWLLVAPLSPPFIRSNLSQRTVQSWPEAIIEAPFRGLVTADPQQLKSLREKQGDVGWRVIGRIGVQAKTVARQRQLIAGVIAAIRTTTAPGATWLARSISPTTVAAATGGWWGRGPLNLLELRAVSGWPIGATSELPVRARTSRVLPPTPILLSGRRVVGVSTTPPERPVGLSAADALMHMSVTAPTGTGKSTLLMQLALQDMQAGRAVVVIDPKGSLVDDLLGRIPKHRVGDVIVVDPADRELPLGLNPLRLGGRSPDVVVDQLLTVFRNLFAGYWGPRTQDILHAALLTLARTPNMTLAALPVLLTDDGFRRKLLRDVDDPFGVGAFWSSFESWSPAERATNIAPSLTRLRPFLMRPQLRAMLGQAEPRWSIDQVFTERKIVLVDLSRDELGAESANLLGSLLVSELWQATLRRGRIPAERRHPVTIVADEFQDYCHFAQDFEDALAKSRSFGVGWLLAHQHFDQLPKSVRAAVQANARSKVVFQLGAEDAKAVTRNDTVLSADDVQHLPAYEAYVRLVGNGAVQPWCSIRTLPADAPTTDADAIRRASRERYGRPVHEIDAALAELAGQQTVRTVDDLAPRLRPRKGDV